MILILQRGAIPNGERKGRWQLRCPACGRWVRQLLPRRGERRLSIDADDEGFYAKVAGFDGENEIRVPVPGPLVSTIDGLPWACRRCRGMPSEASQEGKLERAERLLAKREFDRRRGCPPGRSRPGEGWVEELRRQRRGKAALRLVEEHGRKRMGRVLAFRRSG